MAATRRTGRTRRPQNGTGTDGRWGASNGSRRGQTSPDSYRPRQTSAQVGGSATDSIRPAQTPCPCLGVKGSPVQIRPSRLVRTSFRTQKQNCERSMGAQRAPISSTKLLLVRPVGGQNPTGQQRPAEPTRGVAHPGALVSRSKVTGSHPAVKAGSGQHQPRTQERSVTVSPMETVSRERPPTRRYDRLSTPGQLLWAQRRTDVLRAWAHIRLLPRWAFLFDALRSCSR